MPSESGIPAMLLSAIHQGRWQDPGPNAMRSIFRVSDEEEGDISLFERIEEMVEVGETVRRFYCDNPHFCMASGVHAPSDKRLDIACSTFIAMSSRAGDDVLVAVESRDAEADPAVRIFDWSLDVPHRWRLVGPLSEVIEAIAAAIRRG